MRELVKLPEVPPKARGEIMGFPSCNYVGVDLQRMHGAGLLVPDTVAEWVGALEREPLESLRAVGVPREVREQIEERIVNPRKETGDGTDLAGVA